MKINNQDSISMTITGEEVKNILLDYINRVAGGVVKRDMKMQDIDFSFSDVNFTWTRERNKTI